jgi:sugar phosphate permease
VEFAAGSAKVVVNLVANIIGAVGAIVFVGFFAYKVGEPPLTIIVVLCLALMVYSFYDDMTIDREKARIFSEHAQK